MDNGLSTTDVRLYISCASNRDHKGGFSGALASLTYYLGQYGIKAPGYRLQNFFLRATGQSSCLSIAKQAHLDEMVAGNYTHWLSLDDDMTFPMDIVDHFLEHGKDVVSANSRVKLDKLKGSCVGMDGQSMNSSGKTGLEEARTIGGAIFLARIDAFCHIPKPHFQVLWSPEHKTYVGEDVHFAALLRGYGVRLWVDHDISQVVGHIGDHEYKWPKEVAKSSEQNALKKIAELGITVHDGKKEAA